MEFFEANDGHRIAYRAVGSSSLPPLILLHGFTGDSSVFQRNVVALSQHFFTIAPDLRGHGASAKPLNGFHVARLAVDLQDLLNHFKLTAAHSVACLAGSLGCAILWSHSELFTADVFSHQIWVDQSPLQNHALDGSWGADVANRGMNSAEAVRTLKATLASDPDAVYRGTIASCLGYRSHPIDGEVVDDTVRAADEEFFLEVAQRGIAEWYGDLMADHTAQDWRRGIVEGFGGRPANRTKVLVVASSRSGCFPSKGPMEAVRFANEKAHESGKGQGDAEGVVVDWGGHWCYWEKPDKFNELVLEFLLRPEKTV